MGLLDSLSGLFGKKNKSLGDAMKDGKLDMNDIKDVANDHLDTNNDGKLDTEDLDVNHDGKTDMKDLDAAKKKLPFKK